MAPKPTPKQSEVSAILFGLILGWAFLLLVWPHVMSAGDWLYPNPFRLVQAVRWPFIFQSLNIEGYLGVLLPGTVMVYIFSVLHVTAHLSVPLLTSLLYFIPAIAVMALGIWRLLDELGYSPWAKLVGGLLYTINPFVLILLFGGQVNGVIAYGCIPWIMLVGDALWRVPTRRSAVALAGWLTVQALYEPRYIFITVIIGLIWFGYRMMQRRPTRQFIRYGALSAGVFLLLNAFWIYGVFFVPGTAVVPAGYGDPSWLATLSYATVWHVLLLHHVWWPVSGMVSSPLWYFALWPVVALWGILASRRGTMVRAMAVMLIVGMWLAKGVNPPYGEIYRWLFLHVPGFSGFRDPAKFFTIIALAYAVSVPAGIDALLHRMKSGWVGKSLLAGAFIVVFAVGFHTLWLHRIDTPLLQQNTVVADGVVHWLDQQSNGDSPYSTFWMPTMHRFGSFDSVHPAILANDEPIRTVRQRLPGLDQWLNNVTGVTNYVPALRYVLTAYGVRYVVVPGDATKEFYHVAYPYSQQELRDMLQGTGLFTQSQRVADGGGTYSDVFTYVDPAPKAYLSRAAVITDTSAHPLLTGLLRDGPTQNLLLWNDDLSQDERAVADTKAAYDLQQPELDQSAAETGKIEWQLSVGSAGSYRIGLIDTAATYTLDGEELAVTDDVNYGGVRFRFSSYQTLAAGKHTIQMQLATDEMQPLFDGAQAQWRSCSSADVAPLNGFNESSNAVVSGYQSWNALQNVGGDTRCVVADIASNVQSMTVLTRWRGSMTGQVPYMWLNTKPLGGANYLLSQLKTADAIYATSSRPYDQAFVALILPNTEKSTVTTNTLQIWKIMDAAHPVTSMILQSRDATVASVDYAATITKEREDRYNLTIPVHSEGLWLTVSTEFHPGWKLVNRNTGKAVETHISSLLRQNVWYLPEGTSGDFQLSFAPYPHIFTAAMVSLVTVLAVLSYWVIRWVRGRAR